MKKNVWRRYRVEIIALLSALVGLFLLVEPFNLRAGIWRATIQLRALTAIFFSELMSAPRRLLTGFGASDLVGLALLGLALGLVAWRLRAFFLGSSYWTKTVCPRCGRPIVRIHRTWWDRVMSQVLLLPIYRFRCRNAGCGWSGQRYGRHHRHWSPHVNNEEIARMLDLDDDDRD